MRDRYLCYLICNADKMSYTTYHRRDISAVDRGGVLAAHLMFVPISGIVTSGRVQSDWTMATSTGDGVWRDVVSVGIFLKAPPTLILRRPVPARLKGHEKIESV